MSYRIKVNDTQIFGNNEFPSPFFDFLRESGVKIDEEGLFFNHTFNVGEVGEFDVMKAISAIEKSIEEYSESVSGSLWDFKDKEERIKKYKDDPRFTFVRFEDKGHNDILNDPEDTYKDEFNAEFDQWLETLDYDYEAEENKERFVKDKADYITEHLDHAKWSSRLDEELLGQFLEFYESNL